MKHTDIPREPRNPVPSNSEFKWPARKTSCLFLSFDFDAETAWFDGDASEWNKQVRLSHGGYGARIGVPKILELLKELDLKATFFIPGWTAEAHTAVCEEILKDGHEVGHHGNFHLLPDPDDMETSLREIDRGFDVLKRVLGVKPTGYRAPLGENSDTFLSYLAKNGIEYSSSWRDDIFPYRHDIADCENAPIELPANYFFDDWMHGMIKGSGRNLVAREQVLSMWQDELEITHEWGGLLTTIFHPQVSGRPSRFKILREFLTHARNQKDIWIASGNEISAHFNKTENAKSKR